MKCRNCKHLSWAEEEPGKMFFGWCHKVLDSPDPDIERWCRGFERRTNADRIRSMSNEELSKFLCEFRSCDSDGYPCSGCKAESYCRPGHTGMEDWLQQPADGEEDNNG